MKQLELKKNLSEKYPKKYFTDFIGCFKEDNDSEKYILVYGNFKGLSQEESDAMSQIKNFTLKERLQTYVSLMEASEALEKEQLFFPTMKGLHFPRDNKELQFTLGLYE